MMKNAHMRLRQKKRRRFCMHTKADESLYSVFTLPLRMYMYLVYLLNKYVHVPL